MNTIRFGAQELGIGTISPKMVEPKLEGDKVVDLDHHNLGEELPLLLPSIFLFFPCSLGFLSSSLLEDELISSHLMVAAGWRVKHPHPLMCKVQNDPRS